MCPYLRLVGPVCLYGLLVLTLLRPLPALAASAAEIDREVDTVVQTLYNSVPVAPTLVAQARGILIFPKVVKGGFLVGGEYGGGPCDWAARPLATTTSPPLRMACQPACKRVATRWSA